MSDNYIKIKELVKNYGSFRALDKISLDLNAGEYVSLLGPNGAGKTTLFQILTGLFVADEGNVEINLPTFSLLFTETEGTSFSHSSFLLRATICIKNNSSNPA